MEKLQAIWTIAKSQLADIWNRSKIFILAVLAFIVAIEYDKIKEYILLYLGQKQIDSDKKEDSTLAANEKVANDQANALVQDAQQLSSQKKPVDVNWYKSKK